MFEPASAPAARD